MDTLDTTIMRLLQALSMGKCDRSSGGTRYEMASPAGTGECCVIRLGEASCLLLLFDLTTRRDVTVQLDDLTLQALLYLRQGDVTLGSSAVAPERLYSFGQGAASRLTICENVRTEGFLVLLDAERWFREKQIRPESVGNGPLFTSRRMATELNTVLSQLRNCPIRSQKRLSALYCRAKAEELLTLCVELLTRKTAQGVPERVSEEDYARIMQVADYIRAHPEEEINAARMEQMALMNRTKLKALFKQIVGVTMTEHRGMLRGERAKLLLRTTRMPVTEIARAMGFQSSSTFSRFFRERYHMSPMEYRKQTTGK